MGCVHGVCVREVCMWGVCRVCVHDMCVVYVGRDQGRSVVTARPAGRVSLTQSQLTVDDVQSAVATALVSSVSTSRVDNNNADNDC